MPGRERPLRDGPDDLAALVRGLQHRYFVGREAECRLLARALRGLPRRWQVLHVHGPSGCGKTTLLGAFRRLAERAGARAVHFDGQRAGLDPDTVTRRLWREFGASGSDPGAAPDVPVGSAAAARLHEAARRQPLLLSIDGYESLQPHDRWVRGQLLGRLPPQVVVVLATRAPLAGPWRDADAWRGLLRSLPLGGLDLAATRLYLRRHGIREPRVADALWAACHGFPLALSLAVGLAARRGARAAATAMEQPEVVDELAQRWLAEASDEGLRQLVQAASLLDAFDEESLAALVGAEAAGACTALAALSYVHAVPDGWCLDDLPRQVIAEHLRRRAPGRYDRLRGLALGHFTALAASAGDPAVREAAVRRVAFLRCSHRPAVRALYAAARSAAARDLEVVPAAGQDLGAVAAGLRRWSRSWAGRGAGSLDFGAAPRLRGEQVDPTPAGGTGEAELRGLCAAAPGAVRLLRDGAGRTLGGAVAVPLEARTAAWVAAQARRDAVLAAVAAAPDGEGAPVGSGLTAPGGPPAGVLVRAVAADPAAGTAGLAALVMDLFRLALLGCPVWCCAEAADAGEVLEALGLSPWPAQAPGGVRLYRWEPDPRCGVQAAAGPAPPPGASAGAVGPPAPVGSSRGTAAAEVVPTVGAPAAAPGPALQQAWDREVQGVLQRLTRREREVAAAVPEGLSNAEIAHQLHIREVTVKKHLTQIFRKANVASRTQLIRRLREGG